MVAVPVPETVHVFGLVAAHLAVEQARLGAPGAFGAAGRERPPFVEAVRPEEAAQGGVGRRRRKLGLLLGQREEVVVMKLGAPALVRSVLRQHSLAQSRAHRRL